MKKITTFILIFALVFLTACAGNVTETSSNNEEVSDLVSSEGLEYKVIDGTITITGMGSCADTRLVISSEIDGKKVTAIADQAFSGCDFLLSVTLADSIAQIGEKAFSGCDKLVEVVLPAGVTEIKTATFYNCSSLERVFMLGNVTAIGDEAFGGTTQVTGYYYNSTLIDWNSVTLGSAWNGEAHAFEVYCIDGMLTGE